MSTKSYNQLTFKERLIQHLHNDLLFKCNKPLKEDEYHTCEDCERRAKVILMFFSFELTEIRQQKIER